MFNYLDQTLHVVGSFELCWVQLKYVARLSRKPTLGVSNHRDKHDLVFFGTFLVLAAARRQCWHLQRHFFAMNSRACGRYSAPKTNSFRSDHRSQPTHGTHAADLMLANALGHN
jgi:hypothetical protein